ncbi:peptide chain release factor N(5)-glutamine methyltransferase [Buchnera aphidicola]|uniref:peptide chain release factor N(5)-glutamine methyltransferase n=1 Tax=Buchnera aphidicola TaxID=9 RepID=UPI00094BF154|nr:peptide chain release factor N(5)-glutamine methyltransferase [Buchnera aphidicola]
MNVSEWLSYAKNKLFRSKTPQIDGEILLCHGLKLSRKEFFYSQNKKIKSNDFLILNSFLCRRMLGEPIAYIIGKKSFWSFSLFVSSDVLIPRPDTEILVEQVLLKASSSRKIILDLGTGSGAIALALASECSQCNIIGVDNNLKAVAIARYNANLLNIKNVNFIYSDWFSNVPLKKFHIIVCNPPYLSEQDFSNFLPELFYEPYNALVSGHYGTECIQHVIKNAFLYLRSDGGWVYVEHCYKQTQRVRLIFKNNFFVNIFSIQDYSHRYRVTYGYLNRGK